MEALRRFGARGLAGAALLACMALGGPPAAADWAVRTVPRTDGPGTRCVVESARETLSDGYQTTTAHIVVDGRSVAVTSASNLDPGSADIGLVVDQEPLVPMDRLAGVKTAVFESRYGRLIELFKAGLRARAQLRFWPEWPATGPHSATFSLLGFTKAYGELAGCR
jgi:hypothetical protein